MAKAKTQALNQIQPIDLQNNRAEIVRIRDALMALHSEVIMPLEFLATVLKTYADAALSFEAQHLNALGELLDALVSKAEQILREHGLVEDED